MRFFLMQRDHQVAVIEIAEKTGDIIDVAEILSAQRIPLGAKHIDGSFDVLSLRKWWAGRGIPASRSGLEHALEALHVPYAELLLVKCSGLSLSDQYWVTPCDAPQRWHDVNFYENDFSDDVGRALFGEGVLSAQPDLCSPCNTSDGFLQKRCCLLFLRQTMQGLQGGIRTARAPRFASRRAATVLRTVARARENPTVCAKYHHSILHWVVIFGFGTNHTSNRGK